MNACSGDDVLAERRERLATAAPAIPAVPTVLDLEDDETPAPPPASQNGAVAERGEVTPNAIRVAREAATGANTCVRAFRSLEALAAEVREHDPASVRAMPAEAAFLRLCERFPEVGRECLVASYAMEHRAECEVFARTVDPEVAAEFQALLVGE